MPRTKYEYLTDEAKDFANDIDLGADLNKFKDKVTSSLRELASVIEDLEAQLQYANKQGHTAGYKQACEDIKSLQKEATQRFFSGPTLSTLLDGMPE